MKKNLDLLEADKINYDDESKAFIESLRFVDREISEMNVMKNTAGWKILEKKIRSELHERIFEKTKDDLKIQTLLALLTVADTKSLAKTLDDEIERLIPD